MPNRHALTVNPEIRPTNIRSQGSNNGQQSLKRRNGRGRTGRVNARVSLGTVFSNWAALVALWALPYLTLLDHLHPDAAHSETLQWSLLVIGTLGLVSLLYAAWKQTLDPAWRARHGFTPHKRSRRPHTENAV